MVNLRLMLSRILKGNMVWYRINLCPVMTGIVVPAIKKKDGDLT
jgi:hypothetical protein